MSRIDWVRSNCRLLAAIAAEFRDTTPFAGLTIGTGIHLEPKTVALLLALRDGGAQVVATGNLNSTQADAVAYLRADGVEVVGATTTDEAEHDEHLRAVVDARPDLLLDNGGDLFVRYLEAPYGALRGGTEETTSGRARLKPLRARARRAGAGDQRQPDQAVRRERARGRPERARVVHPHHQPDDERPHRHGVRLRRLREGRRRELPRRARDRRRRRDRSGHAAAGVARRVRGAVARGRAARRRHRRHGHRRPRP